MGGAVIFGWPEENHRKRGKALKEVSATKESQSRQDAWWKVRYLDSTPGTGNRRSRRRKDTEKESGKNQKEKTGVGGPDQLWERRKSVCPKCGVKKNKNPGDQKKKGRTMDKTSRAEKKKEGHKSFLKSQQNEGAENQEWGKKRGKRNLRKRQDQHMGNQGVNGEQVPNQGGGGERQGKKRQISDKGGFNKAEHVFESLDAQ